MFVTAPGTGKNGTTKGTTLKHLPRQKSRTLSHVWLRGWLQDPHHLNSRLHRFLLYQILLKFRRCEPKHCLNGCTAQKQSGVWSRWMEDKLLLSEASNTPDDQFQNCGGPLTLGCFLIFSGAIRFNLLFFLFIFYFGIFHFCDFKFFFFTLDH